MVGTPSRNRIWLGQNNQPEHSQPCQARLDHLPPTSMTSLGRSLIFSAGSCIICEMRGLRKVSYKGEHFVSPYSQERITPRILNKHFWLRGRPLPLFLNFLLICIKGLFYSSADLSSVNFSLRLSSSRHRDLIPFHILWCSTFSPGQCKSLGHIVKYQALEKSFPREKSFVSH